MVDGGVAGLGRKTIAARRINRLDGDSSGGCGTIGNSGGGLSVRVSWSRCSNFGVIFNASFRTATGLFGSIYRLYNKSVTDCHVLSSASLTSVRVRVSVRIMVVVMTVVEDPDAKV